jgi:hypothetical protein
MTLSLSLLQLNRNFYTPQMTNLGVHELIPAATDNRQGAIAKITHFDSVIRSKVIILLFFIFYLSAKVTGNELILAG